MHVAASTGRVVAGRYLLQHPIGRGAMGTVWRARDSVLDRDVAVKEVRIRGGAMCDETQVLYERTLREARTAARLNHPAVVTVFDVVDADGSPWIVMELVEARSLEQVLAEDGPLLPGQAADLGSRVLDALHCAHAAGHPASRRQAEQRADRHERPGRADRFRHRHAGRRRQPDPGRDGDGHAWVHRPGTRPR